MKTLFDGVKEAPTLANVSRFMCALTTLCSELQENAQAANGYEERLGAHPTTVCFPGDCEFENTDPITCKRKKHNRQLIQIHPNTRSLYSVSSIIKGAVPLSYLPQVHRLVLGRLTTYQ